MSLIPPPKWPLHRRPQLSASALWGLTTLVVLMLGTARAQAYSGRMHMMLANKIREALIAGNGRHIALQFAPYSATLSEQDASAIIAHPLAFRAGAIGPDNVVFPGLTEASHGLEQGPYEQCELLVGEAVTPEERAYALGCLLHGAGDNVIHHYVNYMSGETFTFNPISNGRQGSLLNVVRHMIAESMVEKAAATADPEAFTAAKMAHAIPNGFMLRAYFSADSPVWQRMARRAKAEYDAHLAAHPDESLLTRLGNLGLAPGDYLILAPIFAQEIEQARIDLRASIENEITALQDWYSPEGSELLVGAGPDGLIGTSDDTTACSTSCASSYVKYFTYVNLLAPRYDAGGHELPSAFDKISDKLAADLAQLLPALVQTVENLSAYLYGPVDSDSNGMVPNKAQIATVFAPLRNWSHNMTTIDFTTLVHAVAPEWLIDLQDFFSAVGIDISIPNIVEALFQPFLQPIEDAIESYVIAQAEQFVGQLADEFEGLYDQIHQEFDDRLNAAAPPQLDGNALEHYYETGLYAASFNLGAAALANHAVVVPAGDDLIADGAVSFDASHMLPWTQGWACEYLRDGIFPLGIDIVGLLTVRADTDWVPLLNEDSPVECHDGSLFEFSSHPNTEVCMLTDLMTLVDQPGHRGSLSRAFPPQYSAQPTSCRDIVVPGLPEPPETPGAGGSGPGTHSGGNNANGNNDAPGANGDEGTAGCGCRIENNSSRLSSWPLWLVAFAGAFVAIRRRGGSKNHSQVAKEPTSDRLRRVYNLKLGAILLTAMMVAACGDSFESNDPAGGGPGQGAGGQGAGQPDGGNGQPSGGSGGNAMGGAGGGQGGNLAQVLLDQLGNSVWHAQQQRSGKNRGFELRFDASSLLWAEIRNPYGPARHRELRSFTVESDGRTVHSTVITPAGWPVTADNGRKDDWQLEIIEGSPRVLRTTRDGVVEQFEEGVWPAPTDGLTAIARVFPAGGEVDDAFCKSGANGFDYEVFLDFARGKSAEPTLGVDVVAGAKLNTWHDGTGANQFAITDVDGFDRLGGTELSDQFNFFVLYRGTVSHSGGLISMREKDDWLEDGLWVFLHDDVGSSSTADIFLEVHGFIWSDDDEVSGFYPVGDVPFEAIVARCSKQIADVDIQISFNGGDFQLVGDVVTAPLINDELFPPAL